MPHDTLGTVGPIVEAGNERALWAGVRSGGPKCVRPGLGRFTRETGRRFPHLDPGGPECPDRHFLGS